MIRKPFFFAIIAIAFGFAIQGCQPSCDVIPTESSAGVRILNAVTNTNVILVYIDGKLFDSAYYELYGNYVAGTNRAFGYDSIFRADGSTLRAGLHHIVAVAPSATFGIPADTIVSDIMLFNHRQSLIYIGKSHGTPKPSMMYLNDALRSTDQKASYARFIEAAPDLTSGIDVYFAGTPSPKPDLHMRYGTISDNNGGDAGTGLSANDYIRLTAPQGLLITPAGDTLSADNILKLPYAFPTGGVLVTIVVRGQTKPVGSEQPVSVVVMQDAQESPGDFSKVVETFGVRVVNSTHLDNLSLLVKGNLDAGIRNNIPSGSGLLNIPPDSVGSYIPFSTDYHSRADFWFSDSTLVAANDTAGHMLYHFFRTHVVNDRSTYIAIDTVPNDRGKQFISLLELKDTVAPPVQAANGRVRFVATSADYTAHFTFAGKTYDLKQRDVAYADAPVGQYSISITDGASGHTTVSFNLTNDLPVTVFLMPSDQTQTIPYRLSTR